LNPSNIFVLSSCLNRKNWFLLITTNLSSGYFWFLNWSFMNYFFFFFFLNLRLAWNFIFFNFLFFFNYNRRILLWRDIILFFYYIGTNRLDLSRSWIDGFIIYFSLFCLNYFMLFNFIFLLCYYFLLWGMLIRSFCSH
jgi:hypothetical protein